MAMPEGFSEIPKSEEEKTISNLNKMLESSFTKIVRTTEQTSTKMMDNLMGPMKLITKPLEELVGFDFISSIKKVPGKAGELFKKPVKEKDETEEFLTKKVRPNKRQLLNSGILGASSVYLAEELKEDTPGGTLDSEGFLERISDGLIGGLGGASASGAVSSMGSKLLKGAGIASLAGGILWGVIDGIIAVGKADEWGVSKVSASLAGFLAGSSDGEGNIKNAFQNAGKFALIGVGIGMAGGPLGMIAGGILGAAIGGILGYIGAENIAGAFDNVGAWFKEKVQVVRDWLNPENSTEEAKETFMDEDASLWSKIKVTVRLSFSTLISSVLSGIEEAVSGISTRWSNIKEIFGDEEKGFWEKVAGIGKEIFLGVVEIPLNFISGVFSNVKDITGKLFGEEDSDAIWSILEEKTSDFISHIVDPFISAFGNVFSGLKDRWSSIKDIAGDDETSFWNKVGGIGKEILLGIAEVPFNFISGWLETALGERWNTITDIAGDKETDLWTKITGIGKELLAGIVDYTWGFLSTWYVGLETKILEVLGPEAEAKWNNFKSSIGDWLGYIVDPIIEGITESLSGLKDRWNSIEDIVGNDDLSIWSKIGKIGKEVLLGVLEVPGNLMKGWLETALPGRWKTMQDIAGDEETSIFTKIGKIGKELFSGVVDYSWTFISNSISGLESLILGVLSPEAEKKWEEIKGTAKEWINLIIDPYINGITNAFSGLKDRWKSIKDITGDDETSFWNKVGKIGKEILLGVVEFPLNYLEGWISTALGERWNTIEDVIGGEDTSIWTKLGKMGSLLFGGIVDSSINFVSNSLSFIDSKITKFLTPKGEEKWENIKESVSDWVNLIFDPIVSGIKSWIDTWKTRLNNISGILGDKEDSGIENVLKIGKEILLGIFGAPFESLKTWVEEVQEKSKFQEIKDKIEGFFTDLGSGIKDFAWSLVPKGMQKFLGKEEPVETLYEKSAESVEDNVQTNQGSKVRTATPDSITRLENIISYKNTTRTEDPRLEDLWNDNLGKRILQDLGIEEVEDYSRREIPGIIGKVRTVLNGMEKVEDAIIYKDGSLYQPSPQDNIIATKENPIVSDTKETKQLLNDVEKEYFKKNNEESLKKFDSMISLLKTMISTLENQRNQNNNVIQNISNPSFSFDSLRMGK